MPRLKVLYIAHNHPDLYPGGAEMYAYELYEGMRRSERFEPTLLARIGPKGDATRRSHPGTPFVAAGADPNQLFLYTDHASFDFFYQSHRDKGLAGEHYRRFLLAHRPDVVHFQHTLFLGLDLVLATRQTLPDAPILYTLHEYLPICHRDGQMVRTMNRELCREASPRRCHECFPQISPESFFLRKRYIQSMLSMVDLFLAPSLFLLERYAAWGLPREKLVYEECGRLNVRALEPSPGGRGQGEGEAGEHRRVELAQVAPRAPRIARPRNRFGFFGQFNPFKGVDIVLKAMQILAPPPTDGFDGSPATDPPHLWVHGANLEIQPGEFQNQFRALMEASRANVTLVGRYEHADLPALMGRLDWVVLPSIWWENAPLVIQEAFAHGRPVICSDIGGMAEKVVNGVSGLHFRVNDPISLADTMRRAAEEPGLWESLGGGLPQVYDMKDHVRVLEGLYARLMDEAAARPAPAEAVSA